VPAWRTYDSFVSYGSRDAAVYASTLGGMLDHLGFTAFLDQNEIHAGASFQDVLQGGLKRSDLLVVLVTEAAHLSQWVSWEVQRFGKTQWPDVTLVTFFESSKLSEMTKSRNALPEQGEGVLAAGRPSWEIAMAITDRVSYVRRERMIERFPGLWMLLCGLCSLPPVFSG
jgi:hypothetical protein